MYTLTHSHCTVKYFHPNTSPTIQLSSADTQTEPHTDEFQGLSRRSSSFALFSRFCSYILYVDAISSRRRHQSRYFKTGYGGETDLWNFVRTKYGIESAIFYKMLIFTTGIDFSSPADSCRSVCLLEMYWPIGVSSPTHNVWRRWFRNVKFLLMESMSPRVPSTTELAAHKESIPWNRSLVLKRLKLRPLFTSSDLNCPMYRLPLFQRYSPLPEGRSADQSPLYLVHDVIRCSKKEQEMTSKK